MKTKSKPVKRRANNQLCKCVKPKLKKVRIRLNVGIGALPMVFWQCQKCKG